MTTWHAYHSAPHSPRQPLGIVRGDYAETLAAARELATLPIVEISAESRTPDDDARRLRHSALERSRADHIAVTRSCAFAAFVSGGGQRRSKSDVRRVRG